MPLWESEDGSYPTYDDLQRLADENVCAECGEFLSLFTEFGKSRVFLACNRYNFQVYGGGKAHEGIVREMSQYEQEGMEALNIPTRRKIMNERIGEAKTTALDRYLHTKTLTKPQATEIMKTIYPDAPAAEVSRAVLLCVSYGLNPLMGHVYLIKFGNKWQTVRSIGSTRLLASRKGPLSFLDDTPRRMTEDEEKKVYGEVDKKYVRMIVKLKDPQTGAEAPGYGQWKLSDTVYGADKGNTPENMAAIRAERQGYDRLRPGEMPTDVDVVDEKFMPKVEDTGTKDEVVPKEEEDTVEGEFEEMPEDKKLKSKKAAPPKAKPSPPAPKEPETPAEEPEGDPSKMTLSELRAYSKEQGWDDGDVAKLCRHEFGWEVTHWKDIDTPERIAKVADYISKNPNLKL